MADRFYTPDPLLPGEYVLTGPQSHHLATVRRYAPGDRVTLFNGDGNDYPAEVVVPDRKRTVLIIHPAVTASRELSVPLLVASALPKGDRADFLIEKLTELGVSRFVPLITTRSVVVPRASAADKFHRAVIEASKQCGRNRLMAVEPPSRWTDFVARSDLPNDRVVLHTDPHASPLDSRGTLAVAIGPEGGLTDEELAAAARANWRSASLGARVLRVETAAIAAAAVLAHAATIPS